MRETTQKRWLMLVALIVAGIFGIALLAGCTGQQQENAAAPDDEKEETTASETTNETATTAAAPADNKLIVGFDQGFPPYGYIDDNGETVGLDIDLAREVAKRNGWDVQLEPIDWDSKDALLQSGQINCIWNGFTIEGREDDYTFSAPYMLNEQVVVVKADSGINGIADLAGKTVATQSDSSGQSVLEGDMADVTATFANGEPTLLPEYDTAFMQLESGQVDAVVCDECIAVFHMVHTPNVFKQFEESLSAEHFGVGLAKGQEELADVITATLLEMYKDGTVKELCDKYADQGVEFDNWVLTEADQATSAVEAAVDDAVTPDAADEGATSAASTTETEGSEEKAA